VYAADPNEEEETVLELEIQKIEIATD
jgi:hypothetical protein